ncbi:Chromatin modification-related protein png1 [Grifola frondosa]|uniref:Chromatin modification-related protein n=1 Tax=Grifola frondosa TaxID=5627 RepID=A0A1C7M0G6_GRIFR|nr:Chromatin modification-related protein png1 [Grifola frondosa]
MNANLEEAANIAAEFVASLDNLPNETQHILAEIKHREARSQELQQEMQKESAKYIRHSMRSSEIMTLAEEKEALAQQLVRLIERARARLDYDLNRVLVLQGDEQALQASYSLGSSARNAVQQMTESLRNAIAIPDAPSPSGVSVGPAQKKRRVTATASAGSIKLPSPAPCLQAPTGRVSDQDEDAEGEEDLEDATEEGGDAEDKELYCFCQKLSYGEMIACDNPDCRYQWFHLPCVNLKPPLPDSWYCEDCMKKGLGGQ